MSFTFHITSSDFGQKCAVRYVCSLRSWQDDPKFTQWIQMKLKKKKKKKAGKKRAQLDRNEFHIMSTDFGQVCVKSKARQAKQLESSIRSLHHIHTHTHTHIKQNKQQQQTNKTTTKKEKRKKNPEQKQQNKLVWPNVRRGACNTGEQDTLTLCTPSPSNRYSQNSENEYVTINAHTQKMNIMSMWMPTCEAQFDSMY